MRSSTLLKMIVVLMQQLGDLARIVCKGVMVLRLMATGVVNKFTILNHVIIIVKVFIL